MSVDHRPFVVRYREGVEREHVAQRTSLAASVAELRLVRAENLVDGIWIVDDTDLERAEAELARLDQSWAADCVEWARSMAMVPQARAELQEHVRLAAAARERASDPAFVAAIGAAELEAMFVGELEFCRCGCGQRINREP